jgi:hypothetical protein
MKNKVLSSISVVAMLAIVFGSYNYLDNSENGQTVAQNMPPRLELNFQGSLTGSINNDFCPLPGEGATQEEVNRYQNELEDKYRDEQLVERTLVGQKTSTFHSNKNQTISDFKNQIEAKLGNKVLFAYYRNNLLDEDGNIDLPAGFYIYPPLPEDFINRNNNDETKSKIYNIENPNNFTIPANEGLTMISCQNAAIWGSKTTQEYGSALSGKIFEAKNSGWILTAIPDELFSENSDMLADLLGNNNIRSVFPFKTNEDKAPESTDSLTNDFRNKDFGALNAKTARHKMIWAHKFEEINEPVGDPQPGDDAPGDGNPDPNPEPQPEPIPGGGIDINIIEPVSREQQIEDISEVIANIDPNDLGNEPQIGGELDPRDILEAINRNQQIENVIDVNFNPINADPEMVREAIDRAAEIRAEIERLQTELSNTETEILTVFENLSEIATEYNFMSDIERVILEEPLRANLGQINILLGEHEEITRELSELEAEPETNNEAQVFNFDECADANDVGKTRNRLREVCVQKFQNGLTRFDVETCTVNKENQLIGTQKFDNNQQSLFVCKETRWIRINPESGSQTAQDFYENKAKESFDEIFELLQESVLGLNRLLQEVRNSLAQIRFDVDARVREAVDDFDNKMEIIRQRAYRLFDSISLSHSVDKTAGGLELRNFKSEFGTIFILAGRQYRESARATIRGMIERLNNNISILDNLETIFYREANLGTKPTRVIILQ